MSDILLTFHCASRDTDVVVAAIRSVSRAPIHVTEKTVRGLDFDDASTAEQVTGRLQRNALELIVEEEAVAELIGAVTQARRDLPVRWHAVSVVARGRVV
jgi:hypothetical protein